MKRRRLPGARTLRLSAPGAIVALVFLIAPAWATAAATTVSIDQDIAGATDPVSFTHPGSFRLTSADSSVSFRHLRWSRWGSPRAIARGWARTCGSGGSEGYACHSGRVRLVAEERSGCGESQVYLKLLAYRVPLYGAEFEIPIPAADCS